MRPSIYKSRTPCIYKIQNVNKSANFLYSNVQGSELIKTAIFGCCKPSQENLDHFDKKNHVQICLVVFRMSKNKYIIHTYIEIYLYILYRKMTVTHIWIILLNDEFILVSMTLNIT